MSILSCFYSSSTKLICFYFIIMQANKASKIQGEIPLDTNPVVDGDVSVKQEVFPAYSFLYLVT